MDRELESLMLAYDAWLKSGEDDAARRQGVFENLFEFTLAGQRPPTLPLKA